MKKPNLVNPGLWTPFRSIPNIPSIPSVPLHESSIPQNVIPQPVEIPRPISRREMFQRNSFYLNLFCLIIVLGIGYFLYSIYLERKIFSEYLEFIRNAEEEHYPGFL